MDYMSLALSLARLARGEVSPNPAVGAILVKNEVIIGQGYTQPPGSDHAEVVALKQAGEEARGSTLYVSLEPHCHQGRTPPCTRAIIEAGIEEVHIATLDPNPLVAGKGVKELQGAGIKIFLSEHEAEAKRLNEAYNKYITTGMPFVTVKFAASLDGKIATRTGDSKWITGEAARKLVHHMRYLSDAVMTGANTIITDNPHLTVRIAIKGGICHRQPLRIIVDGLGRTPPLSCIFNEPGRTMVVIGMDVPPAKKQALKDRGAELLELPADDGTMDLKQLLTVLGQRQITGIFVEAGGILLGSLFDAGLVDKVVAFLAPMVIGGQEARPSVAGRGVEKLIDSAKLKQVNIEKVGDDIMVIGYVVK
jgi:diaminohydroxyphosphoribosylaminopyrimidine deaminase / 5-amino-6-(5-phosphoribosylamino)uracil reductase